MAASTQDIREYLGKVETLYEACLIIARRGRFINQEEISRKKELEILDDSDLMDPGLEMETEEYIPPSVDDIKPVMRARQEFLDDKLEYHYEAHKHNK